MINLKELNKLLDKAIESGTSVCWGNVTMSELIRLAEIGKRYEESDGMIPFNIFGVNSEGKTNIDGNVR